MHNNENFKLIINSFLKHSIMPFYHKV